MTAPDDRRMFAPLRRGEAMSPETRLVLVLRGHHAGATAAALADEMLRAGLAIGTEPPVTKRVAELLRELEQAGKVERIPDGRYRAVRVPPPS
jgi:hypothetical protein